MPINAQGYFQANPDVAAAYAANSLGMTPEQYAQNHYNNFGKAEGRFMPTWANTSATTLSNMASPVVAASNQATTNAVDTEPKILSTPSLAEQILASSDPTKWTGEGFGSAQANAADMAKILGAAGITNINQLGVKTVTVPGTAYWSGSDNGDYVTTPDTTQQVYYNKDTGQAITPGYDRAGGNIFSGTFAGAGSTGYGVQYDAQGNPHFYTQYGGSTSDAGTIAPILGIAAAAFGVPALIGGALAPAAGAATQAALGGAVLGGGISGVAGGNVLQGALLGGAGGYLGSQLSGTQMPTDIGAGGGGGQYISPDQFAADYSLGNYGNLDYMNGGQGLLPDTAGGLESMGGAQGLNALALQPGLESMGGAQGLTVPAAGSTTGQTIGQLGLSTSGADILGGTLGQNLASTTTGVNNAALNAGTSSLTPTTVAGTAAGSGLLNTLTNTPLGTATLLSAGTGLLGNLATNNAISNAASNQTAAAQQAGSTLKDIYNQQLGFVQPYQQLGTQGVNAISANMPYLQHQFNAADLQAGLAPNYDFMLQQGQMANQRAANMGGGAIGGNALQGLNKFTQDYAGNAYQNAFNNYQTQRQNIYNTLSNIAGLGQTANQQAIGAGTGYGQQQTALTTGLAAAQAGANVAQAQNTSNTLNNIANNVTLASLLGQRQSVAGQ